MSAVLRTVVLAGLCASAGPAKARWIEVETPHFHIYSDGSESQLRDMAATLEDYDRLLRLLTGTQQPPAPNKLDVYLVGSLDQLRIVDPRLSSDVAGFYSATAGQIAAFGIRATGGGLDGRQVLFHEYAHHFMMQYYPTSYPSWYVEGFAEYMMTAQFQPKTIEFGSFNMGRAYALLNESWIPARTLLEADPSKLKSSERAMFYAESWLAVHYFFRTGKNDALAQFLHARTAGEEQQAAFVKALGMDYAAFDKVLRHYMAGSLSYSRIKRTADPQAAIFVPHVVPSPSDDLVLERAAIRRGQGRQNGAVLLVRVRKSAAEDPEDPFAKAVLAEAEIAFGDVAKGAAHIDALLSLKPDDVDLLYWRGQAALRQGREDAARREALFGEARTFFARAFRVDPNHVPTLMAYVMTKPEQPLSDTVLDVLLKAQELAPQVGSIALMSATALMARDHFDEAVILLQPVATDPHGGGEAEAARRLIAAAEKHEQAPPAVLVDGDDADEGEGGGKPR